MWRFIMTWVQARPTLVLNVPLEWKEKSTWDKYALSFDRLGALNLEENLAPGKHTLKIKVSKNKEEQSLVSKQDLYTLSIRSITT